MTQLTAEVSSIVHAPAAEGGLVALPERLRRELQDLGRRGYPGEACALLLGERDGGMWSIQRLVPARNLRAGERDDRYLLDPDAYVRADLEAKTHRLDVIGVWHSHPDCPPVPSATDREAAWPRWIYLILTVEAAATGSLRAWELVGEGFVERFFQQE